MTVGGCLSGHAVCRQLNQQVGGATGRSCGVLRNGYLVRDAANASAVVAGAHDEGLPVDAVIGAEVLVDGHKLPCASIGSLYARNYLIQLLIFLSLLRMNNFNFFTTGL